MPDTPARLNISSIKDVGIVEFIDNKILDEISIAEMGQQILDLIGTRDRPKLLSDFVNVHHLSSAALGMLISINNRIKQQSGQLRLANIRPQIMEVFKITRLDQVFRIGATRQEALAMFE